MFRSLFDRTHVEHELAALHDIIVSDVHLVVRFAVEGNFTDVAVGVGVVVGLHLECSARHCYLGFLKDGRTEPIATARGLNLLESKR